MKLHLLRLRGIGPFRDEVAIDFTALGASGMFLLEGPTGSGKSTVLDAIVYALYGSVAGDGASGDRIRSQFADPRTQSLIDLIFETSHGLYRVLRTPEYFRPRKRRSVSGSDTLVKEQAKALLWRLGSPDLITEALEDTAGQGAGLTPIASRLDEVGREIARAVGLSRAQFTQTVLLPQNEFARFLRARTGERQGVLQRVFGTEIYEDIEKQLEQMRRDAAKQVDAATAALDRALAGFLEACALEDEQMRAALEGHAEHRRFDELTDCLQQVSDQATAASQEAAARSQAARARESEARATADSAAIRLQRIDRRRELDQLAARLAAQAKDAASARTRLDRDRLAQPIAGAISRRDQARRTQADREKARLAQLERHRESHPELVELAEGAHPLEDLADAVEEATSRAGALTALVELEQGLPDREEALATRRAALEEERTALAELDQQIAARPEARSRLVTERDTARQGAEGLADARTVATEAARRLEQARTATRLAADVTAAETAAATARDAADRAAIHEAEQRRRRNAGLAAELAYGLAEGDPCPVCGATAHPEPAETGADHFDAETVDTAEEERGVADAAHQSARERLTLARSKHEQALELAGGLSVEDAETAQHEAAAAVEAITAQQAEATRLEKVLEEHDEHDRTLSARRQKQAVAIEGETSALTALATALEEDQQRLTAARAGAATVAAQRRAHTERARIGRELREAHVSADQAATRAAELAAEVDQATAHARELAAELAGPADLAEPTDAAEPTDPAEPTEPAGAADPAAPADLADFADDEAVRDALLGDRDRADLEAQLSRRATDQARHADGMAEEGIAEADPSEAARTAAAEALETLRAAVGQAQSATTAADQQAGRLAATAQATTAARERVDTAVAQLTAVGEDAGAVVRVADLATGRSADGDRIQLSTYVLMRRFEDVIDAANSRLSQFSGSTLELIRDTGARGVRKTGLDLQIIDHRTDESRLPETLSGGETFIVSLALALGLADIVTGEAGGVQMETLFIDEGFGSLDPEALDRVVAEIGKLADHGRTIGVVSHVGEMKSRIAEQIHVRRTPAGPSTLSVSA